MTRASTLHIPSRWHLKATSSISCSRMATRWASSTLILLRESRADGSATASGDRCPKRKPRQRKWPRSMQTTMRRATCRFCTGSITPMIRAEAAAVLVQVRGPIPVQIRAGPLPIPTVLRCTRAATLQLRVPAVRVRAARVPAAQANPILDQAPARIRAAIRARRLPIRIVPFCIARTTAQRLAADRVTTQAAPS